MPATPQQQSAIDHDPSFHGRILAGPGTGKSWVSIALIERLARDHPHLNIRHLTFTRAATVDIQGKLAHADTGSLGIEPPSTIHSFCLRLLMKVQENNPLPMPLRIPDSWENETLLRPDIARRLRQRFEGVNTLTVRTLEHEMAAGWACLDPNHILLADIDDQLCNAYVGLWQQHRQLFGYCILAELPFQAMAVIEDFDLSFADLDLLIVDEYQDLNAAEIEVIRTLARRNVRVLAIGDDDQSIYGFRMAAPEGIRQFPRDFAVQAHHNYPLTVSMRCKAEVLTPARQLIEADPGRIPRPSMVANDGQSTPGYFAYARFKDEKGEAQGVASIVAARIAAGVPAGEIAILVRSSLDNWTRELTPALEGQGLTLVSNAWVLDALSNHEMRRVLSIARLAVDQYDSIAWWSLLEVTKRINAQSFVDYVYRLCSQGESFAHALLRLYPSFDGSPSATSARKISELIGDTLAAISDMNIEDAPLDDTGWGGYLLSQMDLSLTTNSVVRLLASVGAAVSSRSDLRSFLSQIEPVGKDIALAEGQAVRLMTMNSSKGLTFNTTLIMGTEDGSIPTPRGELAEERRLLYVAMTRATDVCVLTFASRRRGPTARLGRSNVYKPRQRSSLFTGLPASRLIDGQEVINQITNLGPEDMTEWVAS